MSFFLCKFLLMLQCLLNGNILVAAQLTIAENGPEVIAVGATAVYSANYTGSAGSIIVLNWRLDSVIIVEVSIQPTGGYIVDKKSIDTRIEPSVMRNAFDYVFGLQISDVQTNDSGAVDIFRTAPQPVQVLASFASLNVQECNSSSIDPISGIDVNAIGSHPYEYELEVGCVSGFVNSTVNLTCQADSTWLQERFCVALTTTTAEVTTTEETTTASSIPTSDTISAGYDNNTSEISTTTTSGNTETLTTTRDPKVINRGRMSGGDIAGTVLTCIFILECICLCVFVFALNYDLSLKLIIGLYVAGICLSIIGIFMSFFGSSTAGTVMNSVEIAGTVLGSVGITVMLGGIVMQALKGVGSKDYAAGEPPK